MNSHALQLTEATQGRLRRLNLATALPPIILAAVVVVMVDLQVWWHAFILAPGAVAAVVAFERWTANDVGRVAVPCLIIGAVVWPLGALVIDSPNAWWGVASVGSLAIPRLPRLRYAAGVALVGYVGAVGALRLLIEPGDVQKYLLIPVGVTALIMALSYVGERFYDIVQELEMSKQREAELAVIRERVRFAGDLHDIQGHTLHVVKLKAALAQKLVRADPDRAEEELREINLLVSDTIKQTKDLAYGQRRLNLTAELENAKNLFEAAGIAVRITREAEADARTAELLGQVLRETTTNILRHAQATRVRMTLSADGITIVNDGARGETLPELRGLSTLRRRVAEEGGELTVSLREGEFVTAAVFR
ncbi:sensor histidine kinase [Paractinoplanes hotanensis]|uniref:Histidine kinase n=1 Tax=Paractinoplanes hotanensis TaxID=2906497 RepID=A0ABT0XY66_9ACTN|nr:histidine kinase [Actinoplanes hotanensis]MCM4078730.1 histidine kinase [Actinoplanes hotanensis]